MAACSAKTRLLVIDIGAFGRRSDGGIFTDSEMCAKFRSKNMNVPPPQIISDCNPFKLPYVVVADEAFPLEDGIMRPYPRASLGSYERIYNYMISYDIFYGIMIVPRKAHHRKYIWNHSKSLEDFSRSDL